MVAFAKDFNREHSHKPIMLNDKPDLKIESLFAFVAKGPDGEGIMAGSMVVQGQQMMVPFVGADMGKVKQLLPHAQQISEASGLQFKIYKVSNKTDITDETING